MSPEIKKPNKIPQLHFRPEGYVSDTGEEFYQQLVTFLKSYGLDPEQLVFSGTDAASVLDERGNPKPSPQAIFGMNQVGWLDAAKHHDMTPASYADKEGGSQPCILLYERSQLAEAKSYNVSMEDDDDYTSPVHATNIVPGDRLEDLPTQHRVNEVVIHKDFPQALPSDALVGIVYIEDIDVLPTRDHGL